MEAPHNVRVTHHDRGVHGYRDAADDQRRLLRVRGTSPRKAYVLLVGLATLAVVLGVGAWFDVSSFAPLLGFLALCAAVAFLVLAPAVAWRRLQWTELEVTLQTLTASSGPFGGRVTLDAWSARDPVATRRERPGPYVTFEWWELHAEREDGGRTLFATLFDEDSVRVVRAFLADAFGDAKPSTARHPFAVRFGPMPDGMTCEGDPDEPNDTWRVEVRCPRGSLLGETLALAGLGVLLPSVMGFAVVVAAAPGLQTVEPRSSLIAPGVVALVMVAAVMRAFFGQLRTTIMRWRGRILVELAPDGVELRATPWPLRLLAPRERRSPGRVALRVAPLPSNQREARVDVIHGGRAIRILAPLALDEALYLAKVVDTYESARVP